MPEWTACEAREPAIRIKVRRLPDGAVRFDMRRC